MQAASPHYHDLLLFALISSSKYYDDDDDDDDASLPSTSPIPSDLAVCLFTNDTLVALINIAVPLVAPVRFIVGPFLSFFPWRKDPYSLSG